jgi:hypothetical protein
MLRSLLRAPYLASSCQWMNQGRRSGSLSVLFGDTSALIAGNRWPRIHLS